MESKKVMFHKALPASKLFGWMLRETMHRVTHWQSDYYYDALWLQKHLPITERFYFSVRACGTSIGTDRDAVAHDDPDVLFEFVKGDSKQLWLDEIVVAEGE